MLTRDKWRELGFGLVFLPLRMCSVSASTTEMMMLVSCALAISSLAVLARLLGDFCAVLYAVQCPVPVSVVSPQCRLSASSFFSIFPLLPPYKPNLSIPARRSSSVPNKFIAHGGGRFFTTYLVSPCISCTLPCSLFLPSVSSSSMSTLTA